MLPACNILKMTYSLQTLDINRCDPMEGLANEARTSERTIVVSMREYWLCARLPGSKFEINGEIFVNHLNKQGYELCMLFKYFRHCFNWKSISFQIKLTQRRFRTLHFPAVHEKFRCEERFYPQNTLYISRIYTYLKEDEELKMNYLFQLWV